MKSVKASFERNLELARRLGPLVSRGVLQHFFVSPMLPLSPMSQLEIRAAWELLAGDIRAGACPELLSVYLHIPFCSHKCSYCIYHSVGDFDPRDLESYLERLHREIDYYAPVFEGIGFATCYLGGGTPTVLGESQLSALLARLSSAFERKRGGEWAFECNPLTVNEAKARLFEEHGFNRVSFGVQTLNPGVLAHMNRGYQSDERVEEAFRVLKACRFWINVDLIYGLPGDTLESMELSLQRILEHKPNQVTIYALSPYTPLAAEQRANLSLEQLAEALEPKAREFGRKIGVHSTCLDVSGLEQSRDRLSEEYLNAGVEYPYDDTTVEPFSLLGLGPTARGYIYGQLTYAFDAFHAGAPFDPASPCTRGRPVTMLEEKRRYVTQRLSSSGGLDPTGFRDRFGEELMEVFGREIRGLKRLGKLKESAGPLHHGSTDEVERFATELLFVGEEMHAAAWRDAEGEGDPGAQGEQATAHRGVQLEAPDATARLVLADFWPGRACFHHCGRFAFYTPVTGELPPEQERLLNAFARLFDRIIEEHRPDSIEALRKALFARGRKLRLSVKGGGQLPVRLSDWD